MDCLKQGLVPTGIHDLIWLGGAEWWISVNFIDEFEWILQRTDPSGHVIEAALHAFLYPFMCMCYTQTSQVFIKANWSYKNILNWPEVKSARLSLALSSRCRCKRSSIEIRSGAVVSWHPSHVSWYHQIIRDTLQKTHSTRNTTTGNVLK